MQSGKPELAPTSEYRFCSTMYHHMKANSEQRKMRKIRKIYSNMTSRAWDKTKDTHHPRQRIYLHVHGPVNFARL